MRSSGSRSERGAQSPFGANIDRIYNAQEGSIMTEGSEFSDDGIALPTRPTRVLVRLAFVLVMSAIFPALPLNASAPVAAQPKTALGQGWQWLGENKDPLSALSAVIGAGSLIVAVVAFARSQRLNRANAVYQAMKEARDLRLLEFPIKCSGRYSDPLVVGLNFYASIDQYRLTGLIDKQTWGNFERDLTGLVSLKPIQDWLDEKPTTAPILPPVTLYDPRFVAHLRKIRSEPIMRTVRP